MAPTIHHDPQIEPNAQPEPHPIQIAPNIHQDPQIQPNAQPEPHPIQIAPNIHHDPQIEFNAQLVPIPFRTVPNIYHDPQIAPNHHALPFPFQIVPIIQPVAPPVPNELNNHQDPINNQQNAQLVSHAFHADPLQIIQAVEFPFQMIPIPLPVPCIQPDPNRLQELPNILRRPHRFQQRRNRFQREPNNQIPRQPSPRFHPVQNHPVVHSYYPLSQLSNLVFNFNHLLPNQEEPHHFRIVINNRPAPQGNHPQISPDNPRLLHSYHPINRRNNVVINLFHRVSDRPRFRNHRIVINAHQVRHCIQVAADDQPIVYNYYPVYRRYKVLINIHHVYRERHILTQRHQIVIHPLPNNHQRIPNNQQQQQGLRIPPQNVFPLFMNQPAPRVPRPFHPPYHPNNVLPRRRHPVPPHNHHEHHNFQNAHQHQP